MRLVIQIHSISIRRRRRRRRRRLSDQYLINYDDGGYSVLKSAHT